MAYTTIDNPELYFQVKTYSGNGSAGHAITLDGSENMQPDLVWQKRRNNTNYHVLYDSVRGATKYVYSNTHSAENTNANGLTSFNSNGFTLGNDGDANHSSGTHVAWCWKESATAGFDIVSYTGNGSNRTISHSLSAVPKFIAVKNRTSARTWINGHASIGWEKNLYFDMNSAENDSADMWNDTAPTSSVFTVGTSVGVNENTDNIIAYLWSEKQGYSKFGSYSGNANNDGAFIYLGFKPAFFMVKNTAASEHWRIYDNKRDTFNHMFRCLFPNEDSAESTVDNGSEEIDFLANGIKIRSSAQQLNGSGQKLIYMAFAEAPFVNSNGVPCNAR
tara:strand:- start:588 stop:1586 length:999 start_codon:yes stop_codon:yes gene_type:complete